MQEIIKFVAIFVALMVSDVFWTLYIRWAAKGFAFRAALASIAIWLTGAFVFLEFVKNFYVIIPAALGSFCGTYLAVKYDRNK